MSGTALNFRGRVAAVIGARTFLGNALVRLLEADERYERVLALDVVDPEVPFHRAESHRLDLLSPDAEDQLIDLGRRAGIDTLVHAAFLSHPTHAVAWAHELEDVGTRQVLGACAQLQPARVLLTSSTLIYGASPRNPSRLTEDRPLDATGQPPFFADKIRAERQLADLAAAHPSINAAALRFAPIVGPTARSFITEMLARPVVPRLLGHDPLLQLTDERDAAGALKRAVDVGPRGAINIASRGVLPISTVLALLGRVPLPLPAPVLRPLASLLWSSQLSSAPPDMIDFLRYVCVADLSRAADVLDWRPRHHIRDVLSRPSDEPELDYHYADAVG